MIRTATRMFVIASLTVLVLVSVSTVQALTVTSGTTLMHQDDFEGALGSIGGRTPTIGRDWTIKKGTGASSLDIEDSPVAFEGSNFLSIDRPGGESGSANAFLDGEHTAGTITAEFMMRIQDTGKEWHARAAFHNSGAPGYVAGFIIGDGSNSGDLDIQLDRDTGSNGNYTRTNTGNFFPSDGDWHKVTMEYARDTSTLSLSINDVLQGSVNDIYPSNIDEVRFFLPSNRAEFHIDAIPEPTSAVLATLALIGVGLVGRRRVMRS